MIFPCIQPEMELYVHIPPASLFCNKLHRERDIICFLNDPQIKIKKETEVRLKIIGNRLEVLGIVRLLSHHMDMCVCVCVLLYQP